MWLARSVARVFACVLCGLLIVGLDCDGDDEAAKPKITLTAINHPKDDIGFDVKVSKRTQGDRTTVTVTVVITYDDEPLKDAEVKIDWWGVHTQKWLTDEDGKIVEGYVTHIDPKGYKVTATIVGNDGEREVEKEIR